MGGFRLKRSSADHEETLILGKAEVAFRFFMEEEDLPVRGNALSWGEPECPECAWWPNEGKKYAWRKGDSRPKLRLIGEATPSHFSENGFPLEGLEGGNVPRCAGTGKPLVDSDTKCEDEILARLDRGDLSAWFSAKVECVISTPDGSEYRGTDYLGACSYASVKDFVQAGDYYSDMKSAAYGEALGELRRAEEKARTERQKARTAKRILASLPASLPPEGSA